MTLVKTSILSAISSVISIISGLIITKVIAVYAAPWISNDMAIAKFYQYYQTRSGDIHY